MMRSNSLIFILVLPFLYVSGFSQESGHIEKVDGGTHISSSVEFIENKAQWAKNIIYKADIPSGNIFLEKDRFTFLFYDAVKRSQFHPKPKDSLDNMIDYHAYQAEFIGANEQVLVDRDFPKSGYKNYFIGKDRSKWASRVRSFHLVQYTELYDQIDLQIYSKEFHLKYDIIIHPGGDIGNFKMKYEGIDDIVLKDGNLVIKTSVNEIIEQKPFAYQKIGDKQSEVHCYFVLKDNIVTFELGEYDKSRLVVIDPTLIFSTFSGSTTDNWGSTATYDRDGNAYAGGTAWGNGYPSTLGAFQETYGGNPTDIAITKYDPTGANQIYATYLGGSFAEFPHSLEVNKYDELLIMGTTSSSNYPVTPNAYDTTYNGGSSKNINGVVFTNGSDIIVSKLNETGDVLLASTYIGGSGNDGLNYNNPLTYNYGDEARGEIISDHTTSCYIASCTRSADFPNVNGFQLSLNGTMDGVIFKMDGNLTTMLWSSFLGGDAYDASYSLAFDRRENIFVVGGTNSLNFPTKGLYNSNQGLQDGFITHLSEDGSKMINSTYWGTPYYDQIYFVDLDENEDVFVLGQTEAIDSAFIKDVNFSIPNGKTFITKFTSSLDSIMLSTAYGDGNPASDPNISPSAFLVDVCNKIYVSGWGGTVNAQGFTTGLPTTPGAYKATTDGSDYYLFVTDIDVDTLLYATFFGSNIKAEHVDGGTSRFDKLGKVYQSVCSDCYPGTDPSITTPGAWSTTNPAANCNNLIFKFDLDFPILIGNFDLDPPVGCAPLTVTFTDKTVSTGVPSHHWELGNGDTSILANFNYTFTTPGVYEIVMAVRDPLTCNTVDTVRKQVIVLADAAYSMFPDTLCKGGTIQIGFAAQPDTNITYTWNPSYGLSDTTTSDPFAFPDSTMNYVLFVSTAGLCTDTVYQRVVVIPPVAISMDNDTIICKGDSITLNVSGGVSYIWSPAAGLSCTNCQSPRASPQDTTMYFVDVTGFYGCSGKDTLTVNVKFAYGAAGPDTIVCQGDSVPLFATGGISYNWLPAQYLDDSTIYNPIANPLETITYTAEVTNLNGCIARDTALLEIDMPGVDAGPDITIIYGNSARLNGSVEGDSTYFWYPSSDLSDLTILNPLSDSRETILYYLKVISPLGCENVDSVWVRVIPFIQIPNVFSPNGDGVNEKIFVIPAGIVSLLEFKIYDRWGKLMFETNDIGEGWDGTHNGTPQAMDTYVFYVKALLEENKSPVLLKGDITLIR